MIDTNPKHPADGFTASGIMMCFLKFWDFYMRGSKIKHPWFSHNGKLFFSNNFIFYHSDPSDSLIDQIRHFLKKFFCIRQADLS